MPQDIQLPILLTPAVSEDSAEVPEAVVEELSSFFLFLFSFLFLRIFSPLIFLIFMNFLDFLFAYFFLFWFTIYNYT